jgi:cellulose synthase/poly-beta-1,6-N-acetylglucosamine synthase-like glycosyltransferase
MRVSLTVPTYKRPKLPRGRLQALLNQDYPVHDYEIIVAEDAIEGSSGRPVFPRRVPESHPFETEWDTFGSADSFPNGLDLKIKR